MELGKIIALTVLYGYWIVLGGAILVALYKWWNTSSPFKTFYCTFFGNLYSADAKFDGGTFFLGAFWLCVIRLGIYYAFRHFDYNSVFSESLTDIVTVGLVALAYWAGKQVACLYSKRWVNYVGVYLAISVITLIAWAG